jgi:hypothetical protein
MTESRDRLPFVVCHLFSVLCPLYLPDIESACGGTPDTIDNVLFKEFN